MLNTQNNGIFVSTLQSSLRKKKGEEEKKKKKGKRKGKNIKL